MFHQSLPFVLAAYLIATPAFGQEQRGLELLILANNEDDKEAIRDVRAFFDNPANEAVIEKCQKDGMPPPGTLGGGNGVAKPYPIELLDHSRDPLREAARWLAKKQIEIAAKRLQTAKDDKAEREVLGDLEQHIQSLKMYSRPKAVKSLVTYRWVALDAHELRVLNLDSAAENDPKRNAHWKQAQLKRHKATPLQEQWLGGGSDRQLLQGALFHSRDCKNRQLSAEERNQIKVEYFVLARNPEIDPADPKQQRSVAAIGSKHIVSVAIDKSSEFPALTVQLNPEGEKLLMALTSKNVSTSDESPDGRRIRRHLAIVVDGKVLSSPSINSPVGNRFMISGNFTQKELEQLVTKLRLKP
jgi:preprotein translocase subunit SecD